MVCLILGTASTLMLIIIRMFLITKKYYYAFDSNVALSFPSDSYQLPCSKDTNAHAEINSMWLD